MRPNTTTSIFISWMLLLVAGASTDKATAQTWNISTPIDSNTSGFSNLNGFASGIAFGSASTGYAWGGIYDFQPRDTSFANREAIRKFRSTDGGITWSRFFIQENYNENARFVCITDTNSIFLVSTDRDVFRTLDAGQTWLKTTFSGLPNYFSMFTRTLGIADLDGTTYFTYDSTNTLTNPRSGGDYLDWLGSGGSSFVGDWSDTSHWCYAIYNNVHDDSMSELPILFTTNAGFYWTAVVPDTSVHHHVEYKQIAFLRGTPTVYVVAQDSFVSFYRSSDYGATWHGSSAFASIVGQIAIRKIVPVTPSEAWALANTYTGNASHGRQYILHTTDAGTTWRVDSETFNGYYAADLFFLDPHHGWALLNKDTTVTLSSGYKYQPDSIALVARYTSPDTVEASVKTAEHHGYPGKLTAYPDPAGDYVKIDMPSSDAVRDFHVYDVLARECILANKISGSELTLETEPLAKGLYYIRILGQSGRSYAARFSKH